MPCGMSKAELGTEVPRIGGVDMPGLNMLRGRRGFTLTEVMTTCTLIAGLGGGGAWVSPTDQARQQVCVQHLQVIGQTFQMADLRGQTLPKACFFPKNGSVTDSLPKLMGNQVPEQAFYCPAAPPKLREHKITYLYNSKLGGTMMAQVKDRSKTWLIADMCVADPKFPGMHNGGANILFADCQVRFLPKNQWPKLR